MATQQIDKNAWATENGTIHFGYAVTGVVEVVSKSEILQSLTVKKDDLLFMGDVFTQNLLEDLFLKRMIFEIVQQKFMAETNAQKKQLLGVTKAEAEKEYLSELVKVRRQIRLSKHGNSVVMKTPNYQFNRGANTDYGNRSR